HVRLVSRHAKLIHGLFKDRSTGSDGTRFVIDRLTAIKGGTDRIRYRERGQRRRSSSPGTSRADIRDLRSTYSNGFFGSRILLCPCRHRNQQQLSAQHNGQHMGCANHTTLSSFNHTASLKTLSILCHRKQWAK